MRRAIVAKGKSEPLSMLRDQSLPFLQRADLQPPLRPRRRLNLHKRSRTRQLDPEAAPSQQTPASFFPRIGEISERGVCEPQKTGLDTLQEYVHRMLLKNLKQCRESKHLKSMEDELGKRHLNFLQKEQSHQQQSEKNRLQQLRLKLNELYGQLSLEENQLKIEYSLEDKMEKRFNGFYDKLAKRFQKTTTVDTAQNTEQPAPPTTIKDESTNALRKRRLLSKFRAAAYAVYFTFLFPKYVRCFHSIRKHHFTLNFIQRNGVQSSIQECYRLFELMKLKTFWKQIQSKSKDMAEEGLSVTLSEADSLAQPISYNFKLENVNSLLAYVLSNILSAVRAGKIDEFIRTIALVLTKGSFMTDQLFLEEELLQVNLSQLMTMDLTVSQEKMLLVNLILIKLTAFSFMMSNSLVTDHQPQYIFSKQNSNKFQNLTFSISKQLLIAGIYLIQLANQLNQGCPAAGREGNIESKDAAQLPLPMPPLQLKSSIAIGKSTNKRISIEDGIQAYEAEGKGIYVRNIKNLSDLLANFHQNVDKQAQFLSLIADIRDQIYNRTLAFKKQKHQQYKEAALDRLCGMPGEVGEYVGERSESQKALIMKYCNDFKSRRQHAEGLGLEEQPPAGIEKPQLAAQLPSSTEVSSLS